MGGGLTTNVEKALRRESSSRETEYAPPLLCLLWSLRESSYEVGGRREVSSSSRQRRETHTYIYIYIVATFRQFLTVF